MNDPFEAIVEDAFRALGGPPSGTVSRANQFLVDVKLSKAEMLPMRQVDSLDGSAASERNIAFGVTESGGVLTMVQGRCYFKGVEKTIIDWPTNGEVSASAPLYGYIEVDLKNGTFTWKTSASEPSNENPDTKELWPIFEYTTDGLLECQHGNIRVMANA